MSLFRPEVAEHQRRRLYGDVTLRHPKIFGLLASLIAIAVVAAGVWVTSGVYVRKQTVVGWIIPEKGVAYVFAARGGVATAVSVLPGERVVSGRQLATLNLEVDAPDGGLAARERLQVLSRINELDVQIAQTEQSRDIEIQRALARIGAARSGAAQMGAQKLLQQQQLEIAERQYGRYEALAKQGLVSLSEHDAKAQAVAAQQQAVVELGRQLEVLAAEARDAAAQAKSIPISAATTLSQLRSSKTMLEQSLAEISAQTISVLKAPIDGKVAFVNVRAGEAVSATVPLFAVSPEGGKFIAELFVPTASAGFVQRGQEVRVMVDAFSFQRFGVLTGTVVEVSQAALSPAQMPASFGLKEPVYRVVVALPRASLNAYGKAQPVQAGMTVKADIVTDRRTFVQWMVDPLLAARARAT
ncbi:MAG TPA: HlyD family efflux transporter periplasmic adaptor subunit [Caulobacter sp.]|nr:HlyD family efflux transporter periplasmic adaptor subunit [Caulobacter sp.]